MRQGLTEYGLACNLDDICRLAEAIAGLSPSAAEVRQVLIELMVTTEGSDDRGRLAIAAAS